MAITAVTGLAIGLDTAILAGVALSIILFVPRAAKLRASELIVDDDGVVREKLSQDPSCRAFLLYDLEGEFSLAPRRNWSGVLPNCCNALSRREFAMSFCV